jgi:hypothetical protein
LRAVALAHEGALEQAGRRYLCVDLQRAVAFRQPNLIGDSLSVALDFGDGDVIVMARR